MPVTHSDRDVEFFDFQSRISEALLFMFGFDGRHYDFGARSCEMIAMELMEHFPTALRCTVSEDGENLGGVIR